MTELNNHAVFGHCAKSPKKSLTYVWFITMFLSAIYFINAAIMATSMTSTGEDRVISFVAMWTAIMLILLSVGGTIVMRRYQSPLMMGIFTGVIIITCNQMVIVFALLIDRIEKNRNQNAKDSQISLAFFSFLLFVIYGVFSIMLTVFRHDILRDMPKGDVAEEEDTKTHMPPENI